MTDNDLVDRLRRTDCPAPSPTLRARVVAIRVQPDQASWSDRIFYSRAWRAGFVATTILVFMMNLAMRPVPEPVETTWRGEREAIEELATSSGLSRESAALLARRTYVVRREPMPDINTILGGGSQ